MSSQPQYASEQDLPTTDHASVFQPTHDGQSTSEPSPQTFPGASGSVSDADSQASSSDAGSLKTNGSGAGTEQKRKQSKPLLDTLLKKNAQWSNDVSSVDKYFFKTSALVQAPKVLWLGCCDSRVPETTLVAARPGDIFVHRNIANQFHPNDDSAQAALAFAVESCGVQHVLVVGHTICGGCKGAWAAPPEAAQDASTPLNRFLAPLISLRHSLPTHGSAEPDVQTLVEANVKQSVQAIADSETIQKNWKQKGSGGVQVHGLVYHLETGRLHNLHISLSPPEEDEEEWVAGDKRARRPSQMEREKAEDARLSALLEELKIPEMKENEKIAAQLVIDEAGRAKLGDRAV